MRRLLLVAASLAAAGCGDRRTFEQKYDDTSRELENRAARLDKQVNEAAPSGNGFDQEGPER